MVRITLPDADERVMAAKYQTWLPSEEELRRALTEKRQEAERALAPEEQATAGRQQEVARPEPRGPKPGDLEAKRRR